MCYVPLTLDQDSETPAQVKIIADLRACYASYLKTIRIDLSVIL